MSSDYGYINARFRAMKSFLLKEGDYIEALRQKTPEDFVAYLGRLPNYSDDVRQTLAAQPAGVVCDATLKLNLCRISRKMLRFSEGEPKELMLILLKPWDIYNLKTIIRGIIGGHERDEIIQALIPAGKWGLDFLQAFTEAKELKALADALAASGDVVEKEFAQLISDYSQDSPLEVLENSLTQAYFQKGCAGLTKKNSNAQIVLDYLSLQIDFLNILLILKNITQAIVLADRQEGLFIKGGRLGRGFLKDLLALKSVEDALGAFVYSPYPWLADEGLKLYKRNKRLSSLERLFKNKLFSFCIDLYTRGDPLSIGIPLAFINFKENEIRNLRLWGKAINFGIPYDLVKEELIYA